jgi:hypothetical protein
MRVTPGWSLARKIIHVRLVANDPSAAAKLRSQRVIGDSTLHKQAVVICCWQSGNCEFRHTILDGQTAKLFSEITADPI